MLVQPVHIIVALTIIGIYCIGSSIQACTDPHCAVCFKSAGDCAQCGAGYGVIKNSVPGKCGTCADGCVSTCNSAYAGGCDPCAPGVCSYACNISYWYDSTAKTCKPCDVNCADGCQSEGQGKCHSACKFGPYTFSNFNCIKCDPNCASGCITKLANKCDSQCNAGWALYSFNNTCVKCDTNCASTTGCTAKGSGKCDATCKTGYSVYTSSSAGTLEYTCVLCDGNCTGGCSSTGTGKCDLTCKSGFSLSATNECVVSTDGGWSAWSGSTCTTPGDKTTRTRTCTNPAPTGLGLLCQTGSGALALTETTNCPCDPNCNTTVGCIEQGADKCDEACVGNFGLDKTDWTCKSCDSQCSSGCRVEGAGKCDSSCNSGFGLEYGNYTCMPTVNGDWSSWTLLDQCSSKGQLNETAVRYCNNPPPSYGGTLCTDHSGNKVNEERNTTDCACDQHCSSGCKNTGYQSCDSECVSGFGLEPGNNTCMVTVNGDWSSWTVLDQCSSKGQLNETAVRYCNNPPPSYGGTLCTDHSGNKVNEERNTTDCACDPNCNSGCPQTGYESCDSSCVNGYGLEPGNSTCMASVNGDWSDWTQITACTSLGQSTDTKQRQCNNPTPMYGGKLCTNSTGGLSVQEYNHTLCSCDAHCAAGCTNHGYLQCDGPCDSNFGLEVGNYTCMPSVNGGWSSWETTQDCVTVGQTTPKEQVRYCNSPTPMYGGAPCLNTSQLAATEEWNITACPCDTNCASDCTKYGYQKCDGSCATGFGINSTTHDCHASINGGWSSWTTTAACSSAVTTQVRTRSCNNPTPAYDGALCLNSSQLAANTETETTECPTTTTAAPTTTAAGAGAGTTTAGSGSGSGAGTTTAGSGSGSGADTTTAGSEAGTNASNVNCDPHCTSGCAKQGADKCDSACANKWGLSTITYMCGACHPNCTGPCNIRGPKTCDGPCNLGLGVTTTKLCAACATNCKLGCANSGAGKCDTCAFGTALDSTTGKCQPCDSHCTSGCTKPYTCSSACAAGYVLTGSVCQACDPNCAKLVNGCINSGALKCDLTCNTLFALSANNTCGACATQCNTKCTVEGPGYCDPCNTANCNPCKPGYVLKATSSGKHSCY